MSSCGGAVKAMELLFSQLPRPDFAIGLGGSFFDVEAAKFLQNANISYWGGKCNEANAHYVDSLKWLNTLEVDKSRKKFFDFLNLPQIDQNEILINPQPSENFTLPENTVFTGAWCTQGAIIKDHGF